MTKGPGDGKHLEKDKFRLPGGYYLEEEQDTLMLRRPDGTEIGRISREQSITEIVEEVVEMVIEDTIVNAGKNGSP